MREFLFVLFAMAVFGFGAWGGFDMTETAIARRCAEDGGFKADGQKFVCRPVKKAPAVAPMEMPG